MKLTAAVHLRPGHRLPPAYGHDGSFTGEYEVNGSVNCVGVDGQRYVVLDIQPNLGHFPDGKIRKSDLRVVSPDYLIPFNGKEMVPAYDDDAFRVMSGLVTYRQLRHMGRDTDISHIRVETTCGVVIARSDPFMRQEIGHFEITGERGTYLPQDGGFVMYNPVLTNNRLERSVNDLLALMKVME